MKPIGITLVALLLLVGAGCAQEPRERIPPERMALVLRDLQLAHQYVSNQIWSQGRKDTIGAQLYAEVLRRHDVAPEDLRETLAYFSRNPSRFDAVIGQAIDSANVLAARVAQTERQQLDSLRTADTLARSGALTRQRIGPSRTR